MPYVVALDNKIVGTLDPHSGKVNYDKDKFNKVIKEMVAGYQGVNGTQAKSMITNMRVLYKWDRSRQANNDAIYTLWKNNPIMQNRIRQLNALVFGRGFSYSYDKNTKVIIDRFWRVNQLKSKLNPLLTDSQLFGECFIGLIPQPNGDVISAIYQSNSVEIDFDPNNVELINQYIITYKNDETSEMMTQAYMPLYRYLNNLELGQNSGPLSKIVKKVKTAMKIGIGSTGLDSGTVGVMIHVKFNNSSAETRGTSDFRQVYQTLNDYMDYIGDRLNIHQMYGSPSYDITIDTDDPTVIANRIDELAGFTIGSNPVHNGTETWKPMEFRGADTDAKSDEKALRGLICAGTGFPEHILFNQSDTAPTDSGAFALNKMAEDMQDSFGDTLYMMHKYVVAVGGGDITKVDEGQMIFPEISTMSEKSKAETYVLKVGANICSRKTASYNTGHNWDIEEQQMLLEGQEFGAGMSASMGGGDEAMSGQLGGRFSNKLGNQDPDADHGEEDRIARGKAQNISTQVIGNRKTNN